MPLGAPRQSPLVAALVLVDDLSCVTEAPAIRDIRNKFQTDLLIDIRRQLRIGVELPGPLVLIRAGARGRPEDPEP